MIISKNFRSFKTKNRRKLVPRYLCNIMTTFSASMPRSDLSCLSVLLASRSFCRPIGRRRKFYIRLVSSASRLLAWPACLVEHSRTFPMCQAKTVESSVVCSQFITVLQPRQKLLSRRTISQHSIQSSLFSSSSLVSLHLHS